MGSQRAQSDESIRSQWERTPEPPVVFIIGLHRSGTTFLYESMSRVLPVAKLTIGHVVTFDRAISSHLADRGRADREALRAYFADRSARTRANDDSLPLSPATAEEYGWVLKKAGGTYETTDRTLPTLRDLIRKLAFIHPDARAVLLKNPWDTANAPYLAGQFPAAKFVFIRREPIEILSSELRNSLYFSAAPDALLSLLMRDISSTRLFVLALRFLRTIVGAALFARISLRLLTADVAGKMQAYEAALAEMPSERVLEISYGRLVDEPRRVLRAIAAFLQLPLADTLADITASRRSGDLAPLVREREQELRERLARAGLAAARSGS